jgi:uncharacterized surface protein with fasciclin (FAS1) repeats
MRRFKKLFEQKSALLFVGIMTAAVLVLSSCTEDELLPENLPTESIMALVDKTADVLTYHVVAGRVYSTDLVDGMEPATVNGQTVTINVGNTVTISDKDTNNMDATVINANVNGTNGVIHVIDKVLIPTL